MFFSLSEDDIDILCSNEKFQEFIEICHDMYNVPFPGCESMRATLVKYLERINQIRGATDWTFLSLNTNTRKEDSCSNANNKLRKSAFW